MSRPITPMTSGPTTGSRSVVRGRDPIDGRLRLFFAADRKEQVADIVEYVVRAYCDLEDNICRRVVPGISTWAGTDQHDLAHEPWLSDRDCLCNESSHEKPKTSTVSCPNARTNLAAFRAFEGV